MKRVRNSGVSAEIARIRILANLLKDYIHDLRSACSIGGIINCSIITECVQSARISEIIDNDFDLDRSKRIRRGETS